MQKGSIEDVRLGSKNTSSVCNWYGLCPQPIVWKALILLHGFLTSFISIKSIEIIAFINLRLLVHPMSIATISYLYDNVLRWWFRIVMFFYIFVYWITDKLKFFNTQSNIETWYLPSLTDLMIFYQIRGHQDLLFCCSAVHNLIVTWLLLLFLVK